MSFLLDTCALSELTRPAPDRNFSLWFDDRQASELFLSVLTIGEIERGIARLPAGRKKTRLIGWLGALRSTYSERILPIDDQVASIWGRMAAATAAQGQTLGVIDGLIAATALSHGYTVVTRNVADFAPTGVSLVNPWNG